VGRYTAGAIVSFAFDIPAAAVDANIARVLARVLEIREPIDSTRGARLLWEAAETLLPESGGREHTSALMELGALVCTPARPQCLRCPIRMHCRAADPDELAIKKPRRKTVALREDCAWCVQGRRILLEQQTGPRWRGLWKLPGLAEQGAGSRERGAENGARALPCSMPPAPCSAAPLFTTTYPFTHHRVEMRVFAMPPPPRLTGYQQWFLLAELQDVALAAPHRRAIERILDL
jgi:A/G-specific adenine glycosylase